MVKSQIQPARYRVPHPANHMHPASEITFLTAMVKHTDDADPPQFPDYYEPGSLDAHAGWIIFWAIFNAFLAQPIGPARLRLGERVNHISSSVTAQEAGNHWVFWWDSVDRSSASGINGSEALNASSALGLGPETAVAVANVIAPTALPGTHNSTSRLCGPHLIGPGCSTSRRRSVWKRRWRDTLSKLGF